VIAFGAFDLSPCCAKRAVFNVEFCAAIGASENHRI